MFEILAAWELSNSEREQAVKYNSGAVQPADLQSPCLPRRGQHGTQVNDLCFVFCVWLFDCPYHIFYGVNVFVQGCEV